MYKLMIVEDEPLIRTGLKHYFDWQALGVSHIVEADNGMSGMVTALQEQPDIVITDIRMPEMDGLQMIEMIRPKLPNTVFIILTGFNEFEYAQKAIRIGGVHAFLLKPLEYEESVATIQACMKQVAENQQNLRTHVEFVQMSKESKQFQGSEWIQLLLDEEEQSVIHEDSLRQLYEFESDQYVYQPYVLTGLPTIASFPHSKKTMKQQALQLIDAVLALLHPNQATRQILTYMYRSKLYAIAIADASNDSLADDRLATQLEQLVHEAGKATSMTWFLAIGKTTDDLSEIRPSLHQTDRSLLKRYAGPDLCLFITSTGDNENHGKAPVMLLDDHDKKQIYTSIEHANEAEIKELLKRLSGEIQSQMPHISTAKWLSYLQEIISTAIRFANKNSIPFEGVYSDKLLNLTCVDDFPTLDALFDWLGAWMFHLGTIYQHGSSPTHQQDVLIFEHIASFIKRNIDQDVTLQMVADRFFYNPSYLSRLFKRKLDKNYMRFVTEIRIAYAQECLKKPEYLVTDVCMMCGYKSYKHFVKTFRLLTQMTPTDYRKKWGWS
ncbi:hypothetical protein GCM10008018_03930 [Paenibacillus marchantiophytorum]|uniref:Response regulator n=1 Tax=Paenibacillus marchantiophytorum TaxID=1619310 RepID=A0ABQ2BPW0_9BACL|nr:response regulator [Paenibacillus marchantiophytorum]GGI43800.1 hypothetical protein GCM10008018_03930 [Paenibacillus marchantiophytorum]